MRIAILVFTCVLASVYADENITIQIFRDYLAECEKELPKGLPKKLNFAVFNCAMKKAGIIDRKSPIDKNKTSTLCDILVSDPANVVQCKKINDKCFQKVYENISNPKSVGYIESIASTGSYNTRRKKFMFYGCLIKEGVTGLIDIQK